LTEFENYVLAIYPTKYSTIFCEQ